MPIGFYRYSMRLAEASIIDLSRVPFYGQSIVCARRARKLRRRGEDVAFCMRTSTGKARYLWTYAIQNNR